MIHLAHITSVYGNRVNQTCKEHMEHVAMYAKETLECVGLANTAYLAGILHDMGKLKQEFATMLEKSYQGEQTIRGSVNHSSAGCLWMLEQGHITGSLSLQGDYIDILLCEMVAYVVASHHGQLNCLDKDGKSGFARRKDAAKEIAYAESLKNYFDEVMNEKDLLGIRDLALSEFQAIIPQITRDTEFQIGLLARLILSALVDADRRDTMEFMIQKKQRKQCVSLQNQKNFWKMQFDYYEKKIEMLNARVNLSPINIARRQISDQCLKMAMNSDGIYKLDVPTGAGKTLTALRYALRHAYQYNKKRIIFVIPLLSVLEQNSRVIMDYVKDPDLVLEHHSNVVMDKNSTEEMEAYELLTENWHSPMIITTMVQFLNTLFSEKMSAVRRMQALCDSVIIVDEVQSVPSKLISMFNSAINFLHRICRCSIVLSSATQPAFENARHPIQYAVQPDLVKIDEQLYKPFVRSKVINKITPYGMDISELADFVLECLQTRTSILVVCNTKSSAIQLTKQLELQTMNDIRLFHLSASMCQQHRVDIMAHMTDALNQQAKQKVICISTQVIEAGVDISFACVIRVVAGIDNIAQAAGRCNRSNEYGHLCDVFLVNLTASDEVLKFLPDIKAAQDVTMDLLYQFQENPDKYDHNILSAKSVNWFYCKLFAEADTNKHDYYIRSIQDSLYRLLSANTYRRQHNYSDENRWHNCIMNQSFKDAGELFHVFEENTIDVIVPYNEEAETIICDLGSARIRYDIAFFDDCVQRAKKYTIHIFDYQRRILDDMGMLHEYDNGVLYSLNSQCYNSKWGFDIEDNTIL